MPHEDASLNIQASSVIAPNLYDLFLLVYLISMPQLNVDPKLPMLLIVWKMVKCSLLLELTVLYERGLRMREYFLSENKMQLAERENA